MVVHRSEPVGLPSSKPELPQPMAHGRLAPADGLCNFTDRHSFANERFKPCQVHTALRRVFGPVDGLEPVFLHPVGNGRFVPVKPATDLGKRQAP